MNERKGQPVPVPEERVEEGERVPYERPRLMKKRSVARVTLFSGSGASGASGLTAS